MRKAQGLSLGYVVVGIIAVVVLVVIILIFTGGIQPLHETGENITSQKCPGEWKERCDKNTEKPALGSFSDLQLGKVCCVPK